MKIARLRLSNLNSLKGTWQIDFDSPDFVQEGIFAIIGETGAGKSTILDAICLAIYGATPRLGKITASNNDIMNTQSGECSAEVDLIASGKRYLFVFQQKRARANPTGKLQDPKREVSQYNTQGGLDLLANKISQVEALGGEILGMDFNQFTRSVLLAQGKFNEFLNAKPEERGELLEKITGTQIYSQIGKLSYETYKTKKDELNTKTHRLNDIATLSEEALSQLHDKLQVQKEQKNTLQSTQQHLTEELALLHQFVSTTQKIQTQQQTLNAAKIALDEFDNDDKKLTLAQKAQSLHAQFVQYNHAQDVYNTSIKRLDDLQAQLPTLKESASNNLTHLNKVQYELDAAEQAVHTAKPIIAKVQTLEQTLNILEERYATKKNELTNLNQTLDKKTTNEQAAKNEQATLKNLLDKEQALIEQTAHLMGLNGEIHTPLAEWQHKLNKLLDDCKTLKSLRHDVQNLRKNIKEHEDKQAQLKAMLDDYNTQKTNQEKALTKACQLSVFDRQALNDYLQRKQTELVEISATQKDLARLVIGISQASEPSKIAQNQAHQASLHQEIAHAKTQINQLNNTLVHAKTLYEQTAQKHALLHQIHALQNHLHALQDGEPCPLCGSLSHPKKAAAPTQSELDDSKQELSCREKERDDCQHAYAYAINTLHAQELALEQAVAQHDELYKHYKNTITSYQQVWHQLVKSLTPIAKLPEMTTISHALDKLAQTFEHTSLIETLNLLQQKLNNIKDEHKQMLDYLHHDSQAYHQTCQLLFEHQHKHDLAQQRFEQLTDTLDSHTKKTQNIIAELADTLAWLHTQNTILDTHTTPILQALDNDLLDVWQAFCRCIDELKKLKIQKDTIDAFFDYHTQILAMNTPSLYGRILDSLNQLNAAKKTHQQHIHTHTQNTLKLDTLSSALHTLQGDIALLNQQIHTHQNDITNLQNEQDNLCVQRQNLIGSKTLQEYTDTLHKAAATAKTGFDTAKDNHTKSQALLDTQHRLIQDEQERLSLHQQNKDKLTDDFISSIQTKGFVGLDDYTQALMSDDDVQQLSDKKQKLNQALALAQNTLTNLQNEEHTIIQHYQQAFGKIDISRLPQLEQQKNTLNEQIETLLSTLGADSERYHQAQQNLAQKLALQDDIANDEKQLEIWRQLSDLIGCSTGKTYRNYVQSLSLDILLSHANHALSRITDRYTLTQHPKATDNQKNTAKASLEVEVIDHYQGDLVRSSKNLSGGESFMVSLALALGLSGLNSQKIQIESLFLDEGFGTLDEETLDVALTALSELEQSGKTIGIISHVTTLKERIDTQIIAQKGTRGISTLKGAGVCQIKN